MAEQKRAVLFPLEQAIVVLFGHAVRLPDGRIAAVITDLCSAPVAARTSVPRCRSSWAMAAAALQCGDRRAASASGCHHLQSSAQEPRPLASTICRSYAHSSPPEAHPARRAIVQHGLTPDELAHPVV